MKTLLWLVASILVTSARAGSGWPYREIVGVGQSVPVFVAPVYGLTPAVTRLATENIKETKTAPTGPTTGTTIIKGSSSGTVAFLLGGSSAVVVEDAPLPVQKKIDESGVPEDVVLVKGATVGPVTIPSNNSIRVVDTDNAKSAEKKAKEGIVAASAETVLTTGNVKEMSTNETAIKETIGSVSANAVIGPSIGPIVIAGPTVSSEPILKSTSQPATVAKNVSKILTSSSSNVSRLASSTVANSSASSVIFENSGEDATDLLNDTRKSTRTEKPGSSSSTVTRTSLGVLASATARINLITPEASIAVAETVSAPSTIVSGGTVSPLLFKPPFPLFL